MDVVSGLQQLGLSEYEARAYLAILAHPSSNGYEIAKSAGLPRAKIYEVLASLTSKGAVECSEAEGRTRYMALDPNLMLDGHLSSMRKTVEHLRPELLELRDGDVQPTLITLRSRDTIMAKACELIDGAAQSLFVAAFPDEARVLAPHLKVAEQRRVQSWVMTYGETPLPVARHFVHTPMDGPNRRSPTPWLVVVADHRASITADAGSAAAVWTNNPTLTLVAAEYVKHDIMLLEHDRVLTERGLSIDRETFHLQSMWFDFDRPERDE